MYIDIATAQQPKRQKKKKDFFFKKKDELCHVHGDSLQKVEIGIVLLDVKGIFMAQSYPTQYVLFNIWVT